MEAFSVYAFFLGWLWALFIAQAREEFVAWHRVSVLLRHERACICALIGSRTGTSSRARRTKSESWNLEQSPWPWRLRLALWGDPQVILSILGQGHGDKKNRARVAEAVPCACDDETRGACT